MLRNGTGGSGVSTCAWCGRNSYVATPAAVSTWAQLIVYASCMAELITAGACVPVRPALPNRSWERTASMTAALCRAYTEQSRLHLLMRSVMGLRMEAYLMTQRNESEELKQEMTEIAWRLFTRSDTAKAQVCFNRALEWITARNELVGADCVIEEVER